MRFAPVRVAAVTLLSGSFLTLGVLGTAQAAPGAKTATPSNTDTVCQALPSPATATPTPSQSHSVSSSPSPSPSPSPSVSSSASDSAPASDPPTGSSPSASVSKAPEKTASPSPSGHTSQSSPSGTPTNKPTSTPASTRTATRSAAGTLDAYAATSTSPSSSSSPGSSAKPSTSNGTDASTTAAPELCVSVQRSQSSIKRGQTATYAVQVSTQNGSASGVSVALTAQPSGQKPAFSSGCAKGDGTASCSIGSVTTKQPASLHAQIAVASNATSVSSVKLTATASVVTTAKWTPPAAAETTAVTAAPASVKNAKNSKKAKNSAGVSPDATHMVVLPLGPIPALNGQASTLIGAGDAAGLFPAIGPSHGASPGPSAAARPRPQPGSGKDTPVSGASPVSATTPVLTAQVAGLIALGLAIMATVAGLSVRKRPGKPRS
jgi:hypothetical protein